MTILQAAPIPVAPDASTNITGHPRVLIGTIPCSYADLIFRPVRRSGLGSIISNSRSAPTEDCLGHRTGQDDHASNDGCRTAPRQPPAARSSRRRPNQPDTFCWQRRPSLKLP